MVCSLSMIAQQKAIYDDHQKGQWYLLWGWNTEGYTKSKIHFKGNDYDFTLYKVLAHDSPTPIRDLHNSLAFSKLTYPQTNFRLGVFVSKNHSVSFGVDHMKYVMTQNQTVHMKGSITQPGPFEGEYDGPKTLTSDFMKFEHTDGLNYINVETEKYFGWNPFKNFLLRLSAMVGGGMGILFPKTNVTMLNYARNDRYHVSGFGLDIKAGVQITLLKFLVMKFENKYGYINMPNIILHQKGIPGRARQSFFFGSFDGMFGFTAPLGGLKKHKK